MSAGGSAAKVSRRPVTGWGKESSTAWRSVRTGRVRRRRSFAASP